eukprot:219036_1
MSESETNPLTKTIFDIDEIVRNHSTISDAIDTIKNKLPFMNEETLYNIIIDLLKYNKHLSLIDNFRHESSNNDSINKETEDLIKSFHPNELTQLHNVLISDEEKNDNISTDEKQKHVASLLNFKMDWMKICECISHEMWPKLSSIIKGIIRKKK